MVENITSEKCYLWSIPQNVNGDISSWIMRNNISLFPIKGPYEILKYYFWSQMDYSVRLFGRSKVNKIKFSFDIFKWNSSKDSLGS